MRAPLALFADAAAARSTRPRRRRSLDGEWGFELFASPAHIPADWLADITSQTTAVPGCWTMDREVDDWPHYTNIIMPWAGLDAPETPERNPVGRYSRTFDLPKAWLADDVVLHLGGFESVAAVWCNGEFVGMSKDSRLAAEFSLDAHVSAGENRLDVLVIRYSDATWIEDQDHWWHGGLHRSVFIEARAPRRIDDLAATADVDPDSGKGHLHVDAVVCGPGAAVVRAQLWRGDELIATGEAPVPAVPDGAPLQQLVQCYEYPGRVASIDIEVDQVEAWTAETPNLYHLVAELVDDEGRPLSATAVRTGFRRIEVADRRFKVNDRPIVFHGVNRHDHDPATGKVVTEASLRAELELMKANNIDSVRCAHYPNDPVLLDLCDELGLWVIDEANVECHGRLRAVADDPRYLHAIVDRVTRMVVRDRNHPCVVAWSLGNESGHGVAHDAAAAWVRATDPSRPLHYEGGVQRRFLVEGADPTEACQAPDRRERFVTDLVCPMYTSVEVVEAWAEWAESTQLDDRPLMLCEFSHAMGNSNGGFDRYAEAFHRHPALAGGFVWDWRDQGLDRVDDDGRHFWAYGGHFGDTPNDVNFCINGLVGPDLTPHPGLAEVAWGYQPVRVRHTRGRTISIENRRAFTDLSDLSGSWKLQISGDVVEQGLLDADVAPGVTISNTIPYERRLRADDDAQLIVEWASASGAVVAHDQVVLRAPTDRDLADLDERSLRNVRPVATTMRVAVGASEVAWNEQELHGLVVAGQPVTISGLEPCLWRAPVDNDGVAQGWMSEVNGQRPRWVNQGLDRLTWRVDGVQVLRDDAVALVIVDRVPVERESLARWCTRVVVEAERLVVDEAVTVDADWADLPRIGTRFVAPPELSNLRWFGRGAHESYPDRVASTPLGVWQSTVADQYHPYVFPQEHGAHQHTRWFELVDGAGSGVRFTATNPVSFSARLHDDASLTSATTTAELVECAGVDVHIDAAQRGVGTGACGPDTEPAFRTAAGEYRWRFAITRN